MDPEFDEQLRKKLQEAAESVIPKRHARRSRTKDRMPGEDEEHPRPMQGKTHKLVFPHLGYKRAVEMSANRFRMSQNDFLLMLIRSGMIAVLDHDALLNAMIHEISPSLWEELNELKEAEDAEDESAGKGRIPA
jgi:hypothetical protein